MTVTLIGAGPGAADLLTLRGLRALERAEVVLFDRLVDDEVLAYAPVGALFVDVGKGPGDSHTQDDINALLVSFGRSHDAVVRLKGGDPFVFGRGGEEVQALNDAGIPVEVVPGVSSAFAAPLLAGIPVTHRGVSRGVLVMTGHTMDFNIPCVADIAAKELTLVVLMGVTLRAELAERLCRAGLDAATPVAIVQRAGSRHQAVVRCTLGTLGVTPAASPAVLVVGQCVDVALDVVASTTRLVNA